MLRIFSKMTCFSTLILIFVGGMVTSTESGLAVPDWPLSYGSFFPPMVGGVFYEHGHRMAASFVGLLTLILCAWLWIKEERKWLKIVGSVALIAVILQGILGGLTVKFFLPTYISVMHAVLAQTFFLITIFIAYSLSKERERRLKKANISRGPFLKCIIGVTLIVYLQLILGALMRHTGSGLAIPDFPTFDGYWIPPLTEEILLSINDRLFELNRNVVTLTQVGIHMLHRITAVIFLIALCFLNVSGIRYYQQNSKIIRILYLINFLTLVQVTLGILTVLTVKSPVITSMHVVTGASILGTTMLLVLLASPVHYQDFKKLLFR